MLKKFFDLPILFENIKQEKIELFKEIIQNNIHFPKIYLFLSLINLLEKAFI
jgi:hypothetical protein